MKIVSIITMNPFFYDIKNQNLFYIKGDKSQRAKEKMKLGENVSVF